MYLWGLFCNKVQARIVDFDDTKKALSLDGHVIEDFPQSQNIIRLSLEVLFLMIK